MTCRQVQLLLEDYLDNELSVKEAEKLKQHIDDCHKCREEYNSALRLKELLKQKAAYRTPGRDYWSETNSLILARTVESSGFDDGNITYQQKESLQRNAFLRSVVSVFASLVILFSAIVLGSSQKKQYTVMNLNETPIFVLSPSDEKSDSDNTYVVTYAERLNLARGMLLIGSPGMLGKFSTFLEVNDFME